MLPVLLAALAMLASPVLAVISITYPVGIDTWYMNNTVALNWTSFDTDTFLFRVLLSNEDQSLYSGNNSIADSTNATAKYVRILLPRLPESGGYILNFVNTTNQAQVFATSQAFTIKQGAGPLSTTASQGGSATSAGSSTAYIPNAASTVAFPSSAATSKSAGLRAASQLGWTRATAAAVTVVLCSTLGMTALL